MSSKNWSHYVWETVSNIFEEEETEKEEIIKEKMDIKRIDKYWSDFFGLERNEFNTSSVSIVPHNFLKGYDGAWIFRHEMQIIISVPPKRVNRIKEKTTKVSLTFDKIFTEEYISYLFEEDVDRIIGPVYQGYYDESKSIQPISKQVVQLDFEKDNKLIKKLSNSGDAIGWENSGVGKENDGIYGFNYKNNIEAIGCYTMTKGDVGFIGVYTNPKYRGKGFSQELLKKMVDELSTMGKLVRYQTLISNKPSIRIASKIGFIEYATNIAIRLNKED